MTKIVDKLTGIRNWGVKTMLVMIGVIMVIAAVWQNGMSFLWLTEKIPAPWSSTNWIFLLGGFVLAVGAAYYNKIVDGIINKFSK
ncbi:MAG: hypothetical protein AAF039_15125 [Bacteroidota bacterium]